ncbi:kinase-like domain-containing protein [Xylaria scruposa]|nr:kinase-like domain-containing protein [Xylaria scruposa]
MCDSFDHPTCFIQHSEVKMASLSDKEKDALLFKVRRVLSETPYACSSLVQLTNGTTNFVFRGELAKPIFDEATGNIASTVIVKHSLEHAALNKNLPIDVSRALYEASMLDALNDLSSVISGIKAPRLRLFIQDTNVLVLEDFTATVDLKYLFVSPNANSILTPPLAASIGHDIGSWLRSFHNWSISSNSRLKHIGDNDPMRNLKYAITYDAFLNVLENHFPDLLESYRPLLEQVRNAAAKEFEKLSRDGIEDDDWGLIHGDFWTGNILLPCDISSPDTRLPSSVKLSIVDWEFAQFGHRAYDIGQMIGDIYERGHFNGAEGAIPAIEGFIKGYGRLDNDDFAFRVAIHAGVHLIGWYIRRAPTAPLKFPLERVTGAMRIGRDWILNGWQKDREYFKSTPLALLFEEEVIQRSPDN